MQFLRRRRNNIAVNKSVSTRYTTAVVIWKVRNFLRYLLQAWKITRRRSSKLKLCICCLKLVCSRLLWITVSPYLRRNSQDAYIRISDYPTYVNKQFNTTRKEVNNRLHIFITHWKQLYTPAFMYEKCAQHMLLKWLVSWYFSVGIDYLIKLTFIKCEGYSNKHHRGKLECMTNQGFIHTSLITSLASVYLRDKHVQAVANYCTRVTRLCGNDFTSGIQTERFACRRQYQPDLLVLINNTTTQKHINVFIFGSGRILCESRQFPAFFTIQWRW